MVRIGSASILTCLLGLTAVGCDEGVLAPSAARDITWRLDVIETEGRRTSVPDPDRYTLRLGGDARLAVRADCNTCASSYTLDRDVLSIPTTMACTRAFCGASSLDAAFLSALSGSHDLDVSEANMTVRGSGTLLRFRR
jgi:heat shock protein HslJ